MNIDFLITTDSGTVSLNTYPYTLAGSSFEQESFTHRKTEVTNPHVEGSYMVNSLRENVVTNVSVWVEGATREEMVQATRALCAAFDQVQFTGTLVIDNYSQVWNCYSSDYTVMTQREFLHATRARVDAQLVRDPNELEA